MQEGILVFNYDRDRYDIRFDIDKYYGGLHCGECFDVYISNQWISTRIEMAEDWYLVGMKVGDLQGLKVRIKK